MKLGVLECGPVVRSLVDEYGPYTDFFRRMMHKVDPTIEVSGWRAYQNELPEDPSQQDGWIISGSKYGAYEDHDWIPPLEIFLQKALEARIPMAGFCFGHQILAQAAGGKVVKSDKGWGLGVQEYSSVSGSNATPQPETFSAIAVHQDQVVTKPQDATVIATSDFCEFAGLAYGDPDAPFAITVQPHPEFDPDFVKALIDARTGSLFSEDLAADATASLQQGTSNAQLAQWVVDFFERALENRRRDFQ